TAALRCFCRNHRFSRWPFETPTAPPASAGSDPKCRAENRCHPYPPGRKVSRALFPPYARFTSPSQDLINVSFRCLVPRPFAVSQNLEVIKDIHFVDVLHGPPLFQQVAVDAQHKIFRGDFFVLPGHSFFPTNGSVASFSWPVTSWIQAIMVGINFLASRPS